MKIIILSCGRVSDSLREGLGAHGAVTWWETDPQSPLGERIAGCAPHLIVLGPDAPFRAADVRSAALDENDVIPVLSLSPDPDADLCSSVDPVEPDLIRAAVRMARLRRAARGDETEPASERLTHRLHHEYGRTVRDGRFLSVIVLSLEDTRAPGAAHGEAALEGFAHTIMDTLRRSLRHGDLLFRSGNHEFVAILPDTRRAGAMTVAERLRTRAAGFIAKPETGDDRPALPLKVTPAVGVAEAPAPDIRAADDLLTLARGSMTIARRG